MKSCRSYALSLTALFILTCFAAGISHAQTVPDLSKWVNTWFKITLTTNVFHFSDIGVRADPPYRFTEAGNPAYLKIFAWDEANHALQAEVFVKQAGVWDPNVSIPLNMEYFAGDGLKFVCSSILNTGSTVNGFIILFKGKLDASGNFVLGGKTFLKSLGGYYFEIDDLPGSNERWAGSAVIQGNMIPVSKVPSVLLP